VQRDLCLPVISSGAQREIPLQVDEITKEQRDSSRPQADAFAGANAREKASARFVRNDGPCRDSAGKLRRESPIRHFERSETSAPLRAFRAMKSLFLFPQSNPPRCRIGALQNGATAPFDPGLRRFSEDKSPIAEAEKRPAQCGLTPRPGRGMGHPPTKASPRWPS
jgi:hypothetical protein